MTLQLDPAAFASFPTLETPRLRLRELRDEDAIPAHRMFTDPRVMAHLGKPLHADLEETRQLLLRNHGQFATQDGVRWAITLREGDELIGSCGHWRLMKEHLRSEIGYDLAAAYWGRGIMQEALHAILAFGFARMALHSTEAQIDPANQRSRRVLERLGFTQDGVLRENFYCDGKFTDSVVFTLLAREYAPQA